MAEQREFRPRETVLYGGLVSVEVETADHTAITTTSILAEFTPPATPHADDRNEES